MIQTTVGSPPPTNSRIPVRTRDKKPRIGGWASLDDVLTLGALREVLGVLRGAGGAGRDGAYEGLLPRPDDFSALPELWSDEELAVLQDERVAHLARQTTPPSALAALHAELLRERAWEPPLGLHEVRWARALLQSRPLALERIALLCRGKPAQKGLPRRAAVRKRQTTGTN